MKACLVSKSKGKKTDLWQGTCGVTLDYCVLKQHWWLLWFSSFQNEEKEIQMCGLDQQLAKVHLS